ncbi:MAG: ferredoxin:glutaredoxin reductase [Methanomicrobiales archaeon]|nr:ferredoxin:glutaredoxin reductase [Methanomicrobiales archaeon]
MNTPVQIPDEEVDVQYRRILRETEQGGYHLNPDVAFSKALIHGIMVNEQRYGYGACPCRLAVNDRAADLDIICPCDYRDPDLLQYGACYCALYVSNAVFQGVQPVPVVPERRPPQDQRQKPAQHRVPSGLPFPVWRCRVCGYLCAREGPPEICPVCRASKDRFEKFF